MTAFAGFSLASQGQIHLLPLCALLIGLSLVIASACVFNNYFDRKVDAKMQRTNGRPLVTGSISPAAALFFGAILLLLGALFLFFFVNPLAMTLALLGFVIYVFFYTPSKYRSIHGTLIGSIAGATPPLVGYAAATSSVDAAAWILFSMIVFWQMPHFFAITLYRFQDYAAASLPTLPIKRGIVATKVQMLLYIIAFCLSSLALFFLHYVGVAYLITASLLGGGWCLLCLKGFWDTDDRIWARRMFLASLIVVTGLCAVIPLSF